MLYSEIIAVCSQIHTKHINTLCGQNVELLNVKPVGTYSDHRTLQGYQLQALKTVPEQLRAQQSFPAMSSCFLGPPRIRHGLVESDARKKAKREIHFDHFHPWNKTDSEGHKFQALRRPGNWTLYGGSQYFLCTNWISFPYSQKSISVHMHHEESTRQQWGLQGAAWPWK
jgi:hypothetical protein